MTDDDAIAARTIKGMYDSIRPISMTRHPALSSLDESSVSIPFAVSEGEYRIELSADGSDPSANLEIAIGKQPKTPFLGHTIAPLQKRNEGAAFL